MKKKDLTSTFCMLIVIIGFIFLNGILKIKCDLQEKQINKLQNTVEQQIELIDALQQ